MAKNFISFECFDSPLHRQWKADRALRRKVPFREAWRGCLGLAVMLDQPDDTQVHGKLFLVKNQQLTWVALRDIPIGHFPGSPVLIRRDVNYANIVTAELKHGMPVIDFRSNTRQAVDFRIMPIPKHQRRFGPQPWDVEMVRPGGDTLDSGTCPREFAVLNEVSAAMTRFAFAAVDKRDQPLRRPWARFRLPELQQFRPQGPTAWMPRPFLSFPQVMTPNMHRPWPSR